MDSPAIKYGNVVDFIKKKGEVKMKRMIDIFQNSWTLLLLLFGTAITVVHCQSQQSFITFGPEPSSSTKHIVLISGDEEYRSEEGMPALAKILAEHYKVRTTVLFAIDPETGYINPNYQENIPGLEALSTADLMIIATRFRNLPDEQMVYIDEFLKAGKPVIGLRTATHAFNFPAESTYAKYSFNSQVEGWEGGFGKKILGETWINHHGIHGQEGTRGMLDGLAERNSHPVLTGVKDIWGPTDVYGITAIPEGAEVLIWGASTAGMTPESPINWEKSLVPVAWTKTYQYAPGSPEGRVFTTTMGAAEDLESDDMRRLIINAAFWAMNAEDEISADASVDYPGEEGFHPTPFGFDGFIENKKPKDYE